MTSTVAQPALDAFDTPPDEVGHRFEAAIRSGRPAWLWPEVSRDHWRNALDQIEGAIAAILSGGSATLAPVGDAHVLSLACYTSGTGPLLGWWLAQGLLDAKPDDAGILALQLQHNRRRSGKMRDATLATVKALAAAGLTPTVLKGMHTAPHYFPAPETRPASDIDLLVAPDERETAERALRQDGLTLVSRSERESCWRPRAEKAVPRSLWLVHGDDPWTVDLHHSLDVSLGDGVGTVGIGQAAGRGGGAWRADNAARVLEQPRLLLHLAVHAGSALHNLTLLRLVELILVIRADRAAGALDWDHFQRLATEVAALGYCFPALAMCERLAPGTVPSHILADCRARSTPAARRIVASLSPAMAQRVDRMSLTEHFMWSAGAMGRIRTLMADLVPNGPPGQLWPLYRRRTWQLIRGTIAR